MHEIIIRDSQGDETNLGEFPFSFIKEIIRLANQEKVANSGKQDE